MDVRILGPLEVLDGQRDLTPRRAKARAVLAFLVLHSNERIAPDRIIEALWGDDPPRTADKALQGHISTLRKSLGADRIRTEDRAYRFVLHAGELDAERFSSEAAAARRAQDPITRARRLRAALAAWRGDPLADVADERFVGAEIARLDALRRTALEDLATAELQAGRHRELVAELEHLVERHPLSERLLGALVLALYRSGRHGDALRLVTEGGRRVRDEHGAGPGPELLLLEQQIRVRDPALDPPTPAPRRVRQERKVVTLLVAEALVGTGADPEDLARLVAPTLARIRAVVEGLGGTAEPLLANAVVGIFGAPRAHEDDPLRAVRAALELQSRGGRHTEDHAEDQAEDNAEDHAEDHADPSVPIRGGIETGEALVTIAPDRIEVTGEVLTAAARLQAEAPAGAILVGETTRRLTEAAVAYHEGGRSGHRQAESVRREPSRTMDAPLVGRASELGQLERIVARSRERATVELVTVIAEPGGGKSRLVRELRTAIASSDDPPTWREGRCVPYGDGTTFAALAEVVRAQAGILETDGSITSVEKLSASIAAVEPDASRRAWLQLGLAALAGVEGAAPVRSFEASFGAWRSFLESIARRHPLVLVLEDIHWADAALLEFVEHLAACSRGVSLVVLCTARLELLEQRPDWGRGVRNSRMVTLGPLPVPETERLLRALLGRDPDPATVARSGGNPLFAHELARIEQQADGRGTAEIPESLQAVIAARLDTLDPDVKAVAADAAVVGDVFWSGAVAEIGGLDEREARSRLRRLVANDVARPRRGSSVAGQGEYAFLHVLVRDVAYRQIPRRERVRKHRSAAAWIERLAGDRLTSHAELIAHHYSRALESAEGAGAAAEIPELRPRARDFLALAGDAARTLDARQAQALYRRALDLTEPGEHGRARLLGRLAEVADLSGDPAEAAALAEQAIAGLREDGDLLGAGETMVVLAAALWRLGRPEPARRRVAEAAVRTLEALPPGPALVQAYAQMAAHELHAGRARACGTWARKALAAADALDVAALQVTPRNLLGIARFETGDEGGLEDMRAAVRLGLEAGLSSETTTAQSNLAAVTWVTAGPRAALERKREARAFATSRGLVSMARTIRAESLWQLHDAGAWDEAIATGREVVEADAAAGPTRVSTMAQTVMARIHADRGETGPAAELERTYLARARALRDPQDLGPALAAAAALRLALGDSGAATALVAELERVTRGRDPSQRVHELPHAARVCRLGGRIDIAESLVPARGAPAYARARICLTAGRATFAEARREHATALELHREAAAAWHRFGCPNEEAHSLLGEARCLVALDRADDAASPLQRASQIARSLGGTLLAAEAVALGG